MPNTDPDPKQGHRLDDGGSDAEMNFVESTLPAPVSNGLLYRALLVRTGAEWTTWAIAYNSGSCTELMNPRWRCPDDLAAGSVTDLDAQHIPDRFKTSRWDEVCWGEPMVGVPDAETGELDVVKTYIQAGGPDLMRRFIASLRREDVDRKTP